MKDYGLNEIRKKFLDYFGERGHLVIKSFPLIPQDDKSLLLINAGMAPLKKYFTGEKKLKKDRATSSQRCIRTADIDEVGKTQRHGTFFEMLGNFSFGDYFKKEAITWAWDFLTNELDQGPCGPCSEIHVDRGFEFDPREDAKPGDEGERFLEVWNLVFTQFNKTADGKYERIAHPNIDTGMGLERITMVLENADNIFEIGLVKDIIKTIEEISGVKYKENHQNDVSIRIIADHVRAMTFLIYDGVIPSNEQRGYVLRRLIRRACRHGKLLGINDSFIEKVIDSCIKVYESGYPELKEERDRIVKIANAEEKKFQETLDLGLSILDSMLKETDSDVFSGENAFKLYDTYGFPIDLTKELVGEVNKTVDEGEFKKLMEEQKQRARGSRNESNMGWSSDKKYGEGLPETKFDGYDSLKDESEVIEIYGENDNNLNAEDMGIIVLDRTTFYGEGGGQVGDKGIIYNDNFKAEVYDTKKTGKKVFLHYVKVIEGSLNVGDKVTIEVDELNRRDIMKNHSATHLLHQALKDVVGDHVNQAGSYVDGERLRFDITHFEAVTKEQLEKVEQIVNEKIALGIPVKIDEMSLEQSQSIGARGLFEDKYQDVVRVVQMGDYSKELCGGTHVKTTSDIQMLKILSESSVAAGVRRIEAITGRAVYKYLKDRDSLIDIVKHSLKASNEDEITRRIEMNTEEIKELKKKLKDITNKDLSSNIDSVIEDAVEIEGTKVCVFELSGLDNNSFRDFGENIKSKLEDGVVILANSDESKVSFITLVTDLAVKKGVFAGDIVREVAKVCGGNGGGRKDFAQAGAKDNSKVDEALKKGIETVRSKINA